jgi:hypothetical protein
MLVRSIALFGAAAGCAAMLACGPVHSVTVGRTPGPGPGPVVRDDPGHGPPPWAPAHGYRHKHHRAYESREGTVELVFDGGLGVYAVGGFPDYYWWDGSYLRISGGRWVTAAYLDASWAPCPDDRVPSKLRTKAAKAGGGKSKGKHKGKGKGQGAAKRGD